MRAEYPTAVRRLQTAIVEVGKAGLDNGLEIELRVGAGAYVCGEETGLIESLEGKRAWPRIKPPFPAVEGLYFKPTIVNNVESISNVPWITANGGAAYAAIGYAVINVAIGSILEPRVMGRGLGLSTLVVFLSLVFWGWVLGPIGMLLSVPLTMAVKIILENRPETRWIGVLLGSEAEAEAAAS